MINKNPTDFMALTTGSNDSISYYFEVASKVIVIPIIQIKDVLAMLRRALARAL